MPSTVHRTIMIYPSEKNPWKSIEAWEAAAGGVSPCGFRPSMRLPGRTRQSAASVIFTAVLVGGLEHDWIMTFHILGMSSSQLTFIFFRGVETTNQDIYRYLSIEMLIQSTDFFFCFDPFTILTYWFHRGRTNRWMCPVYAVVTQIAHAPKVCSLCNCRDRLGGKITSDGSKYYRERERAALQTGKYGKYTYIVPQ